MQSIEKHINEYYITASIRNWHCQTEKACLPHQRDIKIEISNWRKIA